MKRKVRTTEEEREDSFVRKERKEEREEGLMKTSRTKTSRWPSRNDTWTEVYAGNVHSTFVARAHACTLFRATYTERKGVGSLSHLSSTGRRADNSRCGANATAAIDDVLLRFLELTHTPLCPFYLPSPFDYHFVYSASFLSPRLFFLSIHFACVPFSRFPWIPSAIDDHPQSVLPRYILYKNSIYNVRPCTYCFACPL